MRKFSLFFILAMLAVGIHAQELTEQQLQAKEDSIFSIKFKEQAHYAEVVIDMATKEDKDVTVAEQQSMLLLQTHIIEIFSKRFKMSNKDVQEIWDVIEDKCQNVEVKRGTLWRVFTYMAKDALKSFVGGKVEELSEEDKEILFGPEVPDELPPLEEPKIPVPEPESRMDSIVKLEPFAPEVVVPELCKKMLAKENKQALKKYLDMCSFYNELMFGNRDEMQKLSECYVVIIERASGKIVTVLDKGESARMNFVTKGMDYFGKYKDNQYEMVFVQEL